MPIVIRQWDSGSLVPVDYSADSLAEAATYEPDDGVYTVANTVNGYDVLRLSAHLARLHDSAAREDIGLTLDDFTLRRAIREVITLSGYGDVKFRLTVSRRNPNIPIISVEPFAGYPAILYADGISVSVAKNSARKNPASKDTAWMHQRERLKSSPDVHEVLLADEAGRLLEGTSSNFYAVREGTLYTALDGVLGGTSREIIFEIAPSILPLVKQPVSLGDRLDEAFITSSSRGVVPVVEIDGTPLGSGAPGVFTGRIMAAYRDWVAKHLETL